MIQIHLIVNESGKGVAEWVVCLEDKTAVIALVDLVLKRFMSKYVALDRGALKK